MSTFDTDGGKDKWRYQVHYPETVCAQDVQQVLQILSWYCIIDHRYNNVLIFANNNFSVKEKFTRLSFGWLVVLRINVDLAIFQPYLDLEAGDNQSLKIQVARPGIEPRSSCSASQELNHSTTAAPSRLSFQRLHTSNQHKAHGIGYKKFKPFITSFVHFIQFRCN